jgi:hypothetical protein
MISGQKLLSLKVKRSEARYRGKAQIAQIRQQDKSNLQNLSSQHSETAGFPDGRQAARLRYHLNEEE